MVYDAGMRPLGLLQERGSSHSRLRIARPARIRYWVSGVRALFVSEW